MLAAEGAGAENGEARDTTTLRVGHVEPDNSWIRQPTGGPPQNAPSRCLDWWKRKREYHNITPYATPRRRACEGEER